MPYHVGEEGSNDCAGFPVIKDGDGEVVGCHDTEAEAEEQVQALYANEATMQTIVAAISEAPVPEGYARFQSLAVIEGQDTEDTGSKRGLKPGALRWDVLPQPLKRAPFEGEASPGHDETMIIGAVTDVRREGNQIIAEGVLSSHPAALDLIADLTEGMPWSVSIEKGDETYEVLFDADGSVKDTTIDALLTGLLVTTSPAQSGTWIKLLVPEETVIAEPSEEPYPALVASAYPARPSLALFQPVEMDGPSPTRCDWETGHVWGHLAGRTPHTSRRNVRVQNLSRDFRWFNRALLPTVEGTEVPVGPITLWGGHAPARHPNGGLLMASAAIQHYDETRSVVADVHMYWDEKNQLPAFSGALRPDVSEEQVRVLVASGVSGDWRPEPSQFTGSHLIAALCVPSPAFPIQGPEFEMPRMTLVASAGCECDDASCLILGPITAATEPVIKAAGLAVKATDTGRVLLHQRRMDDDNAPGDWEFPGGWLDDGDEDPFEAAKREFEEETGATLPDGKIVHSEVTEATDYIQFVYLVPEEFEVMGGVDETGANCCAWFDPERVHPNTPSSILRPEAVENDWDAIVAAGETEPLEEPAVAASSRPPARVYSLALAGLERATGEIRRQNLEDRLSRVAGILGQ